MSFPLMGSTKLITLLVHLCLLRSKGMNIHAVLAFLMRTSSSWYLPGTPVLQYSDAVDAAETSSYSGVQYLLMSKCH